MPRYILVRLENDTFALYEARPGNVDGEWQYRHIVSAGGEIPSLDDLRAKVQEMLETVDLNTITEFADIAPYVQAG